MLKHLIHVKAARNTGVSVPQVSGARQQTNRVATERSSACYAKESGVNAFVARVPRETQPTPNACTFGGNT